MFEGLERSTRKSLHFVRGWIGIDMNGSCFLWLLSLTLWKMLVGRSGVLSRGALSLSSLKCLLHPCVLCSRMKHSDSGRAEEGVREMSSRLVLFLELCGIFFYNEFLMTWESLKALPSCLGCFVTISIPIVCLILCAMSGLAGKCGWEYNPTFNWTNQQKHPCL